MDKVVPADVREAFAAPKNYLLWLFPFAVSATGLLWLHWVTGFRLRHFLTAGKYPSFVIGVLGALLLGFALDRSQVAPKWLGLPEILWASAVYLGILIVSGGLREILESSHAEKVTDGVFPIGPKETSRRGLGEVPIDRIIAWSSREKPIQTSDEALIDFPRFHSRAKTILEYLAGSKGNAVAVAGPFGSGKTSLVNLVREEARAIPSSRLWFVQVSCWGFDNPGAAQESVLNQIVNALSARVDCFAIQGMPAKYVEALSKTSNYLESAFRFASSPDPDAQIRRVSPILQAVSARLVVVIEDTDRRSAAFDTTSIEGLLNRFRDVPNISFIVTAGSESTMDFTRLCEYTVVIPDVEGDLVLDMIDCFRRHCRESFPDDIDLVAVDRRRTIRPGMTGAFERAMAPFGGGVWEWALAKMIATPRNLKATIRRFRHAWETLHGEVDIDELLTASCLRVCAPKAFEFLIRRAGDFPKAGTDTKSGSEPKLDDLRKEWESLSTPGVDMDAAGALLQVLFPPAAALFKKNYSPIESIQQFRSNERPIYQDRIFNEMLEPGTVSDQTVLRAVVKAKKGDWHELIQQLLASEEFLGVFLFFQPHLVTGEDVQIVVAGMLTATREKFGNKANEDSPAVREACILFRTNFLLSLDYPDRVCALIEPCIPGSLELAAELSSMLLGGVPDQMRKLVAHRVMSKLENAFSGEGRIRLADSLDDAIPWTLHRFLMMEVDPREQNPTMDLKKWAWLGSILLDGVRRIPGKFIPQVGVALGLTIDHPSLPSDFIVNEPWVDALFGPQAKELMLELAKPFPVNPKMDQAKYAINLSLISIRAQKWLTMHP